MVWFCRLVGFSMIKDGTTLVFALQIKDKYEFQISEHVWQFSEC